LAARWSVLQRSAGSARWSTAQFSAANAIGKTADTIGTGVEALQELRFAAKASGVEQQILRRLRNLVLGLIARRLAVGQGQQPLQLRGVEPDQVEIEAFIAQPRQLLRQQRIVPAGLQGDLVVGYDVGPLLRLAQVSKRITGTSASPSFRAASSRPWPASIPAFSSTRIGLVQPNSTMLAAIWPTCASLCVRGLRSYGRRRSIGHSSIRPASATNPAAGEWSSTVAVPALALDHRDDGGADRDHREGQIDDRGRMFGELRHQERKERRQTGGRARLAQPLEQPAAAPR
jgi:hypothetical protein